MSQQLIEFIDNFIDDLFFYSESKRRCHKLFIKDMMIGILGSKSTIIANVARFLLSNTTLKHTEKRLCRSLKNQNIPWEDLYLRSTHLAGLRVGNSDIIAFDPGDIIKKYADKMEGLYRVHDGSEDTCGNGYENFAVEAIQWKEGKKYHLPLYQHITNAGFDDYVSQNQQIINAIERVYGAIGKKGIWVFDRGHDRSRIYENGLFKFPIKWIVRVKENRSVIPSNKRYLKGNKKRMGLLTLAKQIPLTKGYYQIHHPKTTGRFHIGYEQVRLELDREKRLLNVLVCHDKRNKEPLVLLTNLEVNNNLSLMSATGYYLERWGKEEGFRFEKVYLNSENVRTLTYDSIENVCFLVYLVYLFICLYYQENDVELERQSEEVLQHFKSPDKVKYKYYRIAQLLRWQLWEHYNRPTSIFSMSEAA